MIRFKKKAVATVLAISAISMSLGITSSAETTTSSIYPSKPPFSNTSSHYVNSGYTVYESAFSTPSVQSANVSQTVIINGFDEKHWDFNSKVALGADHDKAHIVVTNSSGYSYDYTLIDRTSDYTVFQDLGITANRNTTVGPLNPNDTYRLVVQNNSPNKATFEVSITTYR